MSDSPSPAAQPELPLVALPGDSEAVHDAPAVTDQHAPKRRRSRRAKPAGQPDAVPDPAPREQVTKTSPSRPAAESPKLTRLRAKRERLLARLEDNRRAERAAERKAADKERRRLQGQIYAIGESLYRRDPLGWQAPETWALIQRYILPRHRARFGLPPVVESTPDVESY